MTLSKQQATLYEAVSNIDSKFIDETLSAPIRFTPGAVKRIAAVVAMLAFLITTPIWENIFNPTPLPAPVTQSYFFITAKATDGTEGSLINVGDCFQSSYQLFNRWGDRPSFSFEIMIDEWDGNYLIFANYELTIKYDNKVISSLGHNDNHISIGAIFPTKESSVTMYGYSVNGWFEKYTELEVILKDKDGTILQAQTIAIQHDDGYTLTIIKSETHTQ